MGHEFGVNDALLQALPQDPASGGRLQNFASVDDLVTWLNTSLITPIWNDPGLVMLPTDPLTPNSASYPFVSIYTARNVQLVVYQIWQQKLVGRGLSTPAYFPCNPETTFQVVRLVVRLVHGLSYFDLPIRIGHNREWLRPTSSCALL